MVARQPPGVAPQRSGQVIEQIPLTLMRVDAESVLLAEHTRQELLERGLGRGFFEQKLDVHYPCPRFERFVALRLAGNGLGDNGSPTPKCACIQR